MTGTITEKCINFVPPPVLFLAGTVFPTDALLPLLAGGAVVFFEVEVAGFPLGGMIVFKYYTTTTLFRASRYAEVSC